MFHSEQLILSAASSSSHFVLLGLLCPAAICPESEKNKKNDLFVKFADQNSPNYVTLCYFSQKLAYPSKKQAYLQSSHQFPLTLKTKMQWRLKWLTIATAFCTDCSFGPVTKAWSSSSSPGFGCPSFLPWTTKTNQGKVRTCLIIPLLSALTVKWGSNKGCPLLLL